MHYYRRKLVFSLGGATVCAGIILFFIFKPPTSRGMVILLCLAVLFIAMTPGAIKVRETVGGLIGTTNDTISKTVQTP